MLPSNFPHTISPFKIIRYFFKHMVIIFWGVSLIPFYMAWVFASEKLYVNPGGNWAFFEFILGLIIVGPFLGGSTLLFNDYWDYDLDKISRRKSGYPLAKDQISRSTVLNLSIGFMVIAIVLSLVISIWFTLLIASCIFLSIIYSAPPIRVKNRPGYDLILNASGAGILCSLAGWVAVKSLDGFPFFWLIPMFFGVAAIYIPTTIIDHDSDKEKGVNTIAVRLGKRRAFHLGLVCIAIANCAVMAMGLRNYIISPEFVSLVWPIAVSQVVLYWALLKEQTFKNVYITIVGLAVLLSIGNILILLHYTGNLNL